MICISWLTSWNRVSNGSVFPLFNVAIWDFLISTHSGVAFPKLFIFLLLPYSPQFHFLLKSNIPNFVYKRKPKKEDNFFLFSLLYFQNSDGWFFLQLAKEVLIRTPVFHVQALNLLLSETSASSFFKLQATTQKRIPCIRKTSAIILRCIWIWLALSPHASQ